MDEDVLTYLKEEIRGIKERLRAIEKEQRILREDILSGNPKERMQKRLLENTTQKSEEIKEKLNKEVKFEI